MSEDIITPDITLEDIEDRGADTTRDLKSLLNHKDFWQALMFGVGVTLLLIVLIVSYSALTAKKTYQTLTAQLAHEVIEITVKQEPLPQRSVKTVTTHSVDNQERHAHSDAETTTQETNEQAPVQSEHAAPSNALTPAPISAVTEYTDNGLLPRISDDGKQTPFSAYKKPVSLGPDTGPVIALGLQDFGLSQSLSSKTITALPNEVTLLISPYLSDAQDWIDQARHQGFETWMNIPFETAEYPQKDTGAQTLLKRSSLKLNMDKFTWALSRASGYAGVYATLDATFVNSESMLKNLFNVLFMRGIGYLETAPQTNQQVESISISHNAPYISADLVFSHIDAPDAIDALISAAKTNKVAIGITTLNPAMAEELPSWIQKIKDSNITLVPISAAYEYKWTEYE